MEIPKFHETFNPILELLSDGKTVSHRDLLLKVVEKYYSNLPPELLEEKTKSGDILIHNRIAWGKSYLKKGGYIEYPERGMVKITEKGLKSAKKNLTLNEIENDKNFLDFYKEDNQSDKINADLKHSSPQDLIDSGFTAIETQVKLELLEKLKHIDPYFFEKVILKLLKKMGYGDFIVPSK